MQRRCVLTSSCFPLCGATTAWRDVFFFPKCSSSSSFALKTRCARRGFGVRMYSEERDVFGRGGEEEVGEEQPKVTICCEHLLLLLLPAYFLTSSVPRVTFVIRLGLLSEERREKAFLFSPNWWKHLTCQLSEKSRKKSDKVELGERKNTCNLVFGTFIAVEEMNRASGIFFAKKLILCSEREEVIEWLLPNQRMISFLLFECRSFGIGDFFSWV